MPYTVNMPKLSPTMETGTVAKWHKKEGDKVEAGDLLLEITTDKATVEHNALDSGWLRKILVIEHQAADVNQPIALFTEEKNESIEGYKLPVKPAEPVAAPKEEAKARTPKATVEKPQGYMHQPAFVPEAPLTEYAFQFPSETISDRIPASPLAKKLAKERGVDLSTVKGTGPHQRIVSQDIELAQAAGPVGFGRREAPKLSPGTYEEETATPIRKVIGQRMQESKTFIPHFYVQTNVDAEPLVAIREQLNQNNVKITFNDFVIRACALALKQHPNINSGFNSVNQTIIRFKTIDISVAVSMAEGLITPIIRHADFKNLGEISVEVKHLAKRAKEGKLELHEYKGGSFTISNMGMYGVTSFQAIINPPQAAILAVGGVQDVPVVKKGLVVPGKIMNLCLSVDHRVVDGAQGAEFIKTVQKLLESPATLLI